MADGHYSSSDGAAQYYQQSFYVSMRAPPPRVVKIHQARNEQPQQPQRKRHKKYTRSKTGCLACRGRKVKCDEGKPDCARCRKRLRQCMWPIPGTKRKQYTQSTLDPVPSQSLSFEAGPFTDAGSSGMTEVSTLPKQHSTPPKAEPVEWSLPHNLETQPCQETGLTCDPSSRLSQADAEYRQQYHHSNSRPVSDNCRQQQQFYPSGMQGYTIPSGESMPPPPDFQCPYPQSSWLVSNWVQPNQQGPLLAQSRPASTHWQQGFYPARSEYITDQKESVFQRQYADPLQPFFPSAQQAHGMEFMKYH